jgi:hypothetical protein
MIRRMRAVFVAAASVLSVGVVAAPAAQANLLSLLPGSCGNQLESQPFAPWGDSSSYTLVRGGNFEQNMAGWTLTGGAGVKSGNESFDVGSATDSHSLALPSGSSATTPASCTSIYHPTVRLFVRNTGSAGSVLRVQALYPGLLGDVNTATVGYVQGSSAWAPTGAMTLLLNNLLATLSLNQTAIAFRFTPMDYTGHWAIDDVYLDPFGRG